MDEVVDCQNAMNYELTTHLHVGRRNSKQGRTGHKDCKIQ